MKLVAGICAVAGLAATSEVHFHSVEPLKRSWNPSVAAAYLDSRTKSWMRGGAMDGGTFCISCHTGLPYALARPALRADLKETGISPVEKQLLDSVTVRVRHWGDIQPYLGDKAGGLGTESVLNAVVLASTDAPTGKMTDLTRQSLRIMWQQQLKTGEKAGSWPWVSFGNEPWEAPDSDYWGATIAAVATGIAPEGYADSPPIQQDLNLLRSYLRRDLEHQSLLNQLSLLWASRKVSGLLTAEERKKIIEAALERQNLDGGWSTVSMIPATWKRRDGSSANTESDAYATGLVAYTMELTQDNHSRKSIERARSWLTQHQDPSTGAWLTASPNVTRDPNSDVGHFMTDAATAFSVLALKTNG